jgi:hypothetical protein
MLRLAMAWFAVVLVVLAPLPILALGMDAGVIAFADFWWPSIAVALLLGRFVAGIARHAGTVSRPRHPRGRSTLGAALIVASGVAAATSLLGYPPTALWSPIQADAPLWSSSSTVTVAVLAGALSIGWLASLRSRHRPARDWAAWSPNLLRSAQERMHAVRGHLQRIARIRLPGWRDAFLDTFVAVASSASPSALARQAEARLARWETAVAMLVLLGTTLAWLGG